MRERRKKERERERENQRMWIDTGREKMTSGEGKRK
jgi:hypothetical protein